MMKNMKNFENNVLTVSRVINGRLVTVTKQVNSAKELWLWLNVLEKIDDDTFKLYSSIAD